MKKLYTILAFYFIVYNSNAQDSIPLKVNTIITNYFSCKKTTGMIIGVVNKGKTYIFSYGETVKKSGVKPDSTTLFEIGEITYLFTSSLLVNASMYDSVKIDESAQKHIAGRANIPVYQKVICKPVNKSDKENNLFNPIGYTPLMCYPDPEYHPEKILLCDLATHTSGLPLNPSNINRSNKEGGPYKDYSQQKFYDYLNNYVLLQEEENEFKFSNIGIVILADALVINSGMPYDKLLSKKILKPLNMNNTTTELNAAQQKLLAQGTNSKRRFVEPWEYNAFAPAMGLKSNMSDMLVFLKANMGLIKSPLKDVFDYTHNSKVLIQSGKLKGSQEGMSWLISPDGNTGKTIVWQSGLTGGYSSFIGFSETNHIGIVILSNTANPLDVVGAEIVKELNR